MGWVETRPRGDTTAKWSGAALSATGEIQYVCEYGGRVYKSIDSGVSWTEIRPAGDISKNWNCLACDSDGSVIVVGVDNGRLYRSTDGGANWSEVTPAGSVNKKWKSVACDSDGSVIVVAAYLGRVYKSTNTGASWSEIMPAGAVDAQHSAVACDSDGSVIVVTGVYSGLGSVYRSTNGGASWTLLTPTPILVGGCDCDSDGSVIVAIDNWVDGVIYISTDGGANWSRAWLTYAWTVASDDDGSVLLAGAQPGSLIQSSDGGRNWVQDPSMPTGANWRALAVDADGTVMLAGAYGGRLYVYSSRQYVSLPTLEFPTALNPLSIVCGPITVALPTLVFPAVVKPIAVDAGGRTIRILDPRGTLDTPQVITDTTPGIRWSFTRTQGAYYVTVFDETNQVPAYDSGQVAGTERVHTVTAELIPGHTYSVQVKCEDTLGELYTSDERAWFHVNDASIAAPTLTAEPDTTHKTPVTLEWSAPATTDDDALTYEVELTYPNGRVRIFRTAAATSCYLGLLAYE